MLKKLFSHTAIYGLAPYIPKLFSLFALPIITKDLTSFDYGVAGIVAAYTGAIGVFNNLGLRLILVNAFYHYTSQFKWVWRQIYGFLSLWVLVFAGLISVMLYFVIPEQASNNTTLIIVLNVIPLVLFGPVGMLGSTYYQLKQQPTQIAVRSIGFGLLSIALNIYFISILKLGYMGWFWTECIVGMMHNASFWYAINLKLNLKPIYNFKWRLIKRSLKVAIPTIPHYYASYLLNSSDRMVMDWVKVPTEAIGRYNIAGNFGNYFNSISMASGLAIGPILNKFFKEGKDLQARNLIWTLQIIFFSGTFIFSLWSKELFSILIRNETLNKTYPLAIIIIMSYNYRPMYFGSNAKIFFKEKTKLLWRVSFVAGIINIVLNLIFVPFFGIQAAALISFIAFMYMGYIGFSFKEFREVSSVNYYPLFWLCSTILLTLIASFIVEFYIIYKILITTIWFLILGLCYLRYKRYISV